MFRYLSFDVCLYLCLAFLFLYANDYAMPIQAISDETAELKNIYAMIRDKTLSLPYFSSYSIWTHYPYILPTLLYWGGYYIFSDLSSIADLKFYILNHYEQVIPFLRGFTALFFLSTLFLVKVVIEKSFNKVQAYLFVIFISLNLLVFINVHYAKHWMVDFSFIFLSIYFYFKYKTTMKFFYFLFFSISFCIGVLSSYPIIVSGFYILFLYFHFTKGYKSLFKELAIFILVFLIFIFLTSFLGAGGIGGSVLDNISLFFKIHLNYAYNLLYTHYDYDIFTFILFIFSLIFLLFNKDRKLLFFLIPYFLNLYLMSTDFILSSPRYALFIIIDASFLATFFAYYLYKRYKSLSYVLFIIYIIYNGYLIYAWLKIVSKKDTRVQTREWILKWGEEEKRDFIIYNTFSFNYVALNSEGIRFMDKNFPRYSSEREKYHIRYKLEDGVNGILLWKYVQAGYDIEDLIKKLLESNYNIIFINEKFGRVDGKNSFSQHYEEIYTKFLEEYEPYLVKEISPYKEGANKEKIGDILTDFNYVWYSLHNLKTSGPLIKIYKLGKANE